MRYLFIFFLLFPLQGFSKDAEIFFLDGTFERIKNISAADENKLKNMATNTVVSVDKVVGGVTVELVLLPSNIKKVQFE